MWAPSPSRPRLRPRRIPWLAAVTAVHYGDRHGWIGAREVAWMNDSPGDSCMHCNASRHRSSHNRRHVREAWYRADRVGEFLTDIGRLANGGETKQFVFNQSGRILGKEHPSTITAMNNLAVTLENQGQLDEAAKMFEEVLAPVHRFYLFNRFNIRAKVCTY